MKFNGVCYDVGRRMMGQDWRPDFDPRQVRHELEIVRDDLHCNSVRICGEDVGRLASTAAQALDLGLDVWLSPEMWDRSQDETLDYIAGAAKRAGGLQRDYRGRMVFSVGSELTLFMQGIVEGRNVLERLGNPSFWDYVRSGAHNEALSSFLAKAAKVVRERFGGEITYASVPLEAVEWELFDFVSVDLYREARIRESYRDLLRRWFVFGRPVAVTEFGCCTYHGAADAGGRGWAIVDPSQSPPRWLGEYVRDEAEQAREVAEMLAILGAEGVAGAFVMTFVQPLFPHSEDPRLDLDMASYSLVKSYEGRRGTTYPDMPWEPKESFAAVASYYAAHS